MNEQSHQYGTMQQHTCARFPQGDQKLGHAKGSQVQQSLFTRD